MYTGTVPRSTSFTHLYMFDTMFGVVEDLDNYHQPLEDDTKLLTDLGVVLFFEKKKVGVVKRNTQFRSMKLTGI